VAFIVLLAYGAFGWAQRRFALKQVAVVSALTGLLIGVFLGLATGAEATLIGIMTLLFTLSFGIVGTTMAWLNRKAIP
jgi:hypothetical protein